MHIRSMRLGDIVDLITDGDVLVASFELVQIWYGPRGDRQFRPMFRVQTGERVDLEYSMAVWFGKGNQVDVGFIVGSDIAIVHY